MIHIIACSLTGFELFFRIERQLDHALEQLIGGQSREILEHELFDVQSHQVAQLQCAIARREHEIPMTAVDDDDVALGVEAATPQFAGGSLEGVARQTRAY